MNAPNRLQLIETSPSVSRGSSSRGDLSDSADDDPSDTRHFAIARPGGAAKEIEIEL